MLPILAAYLFVGLPLTNDCMPSASKECQGLTMDVAAQPFASDRLHLTCRLSHGSYLGWWLGNSACQFIPLTVRFFDANGEYVSETTNNISLSQDFCYKASSASESFSFEVVLPNQACAMRVAFGTSLITDLVPLK
jgi:hypothetical protein